VKMKANEQLSGSSLQYVRSYDDHAAQGLCRMYGMYNASGPICNDRCRYTSRTRNQCGKMPIVYFCNPARAAPVLKCALSRIMYECTVNRIPMHWAGYNCLHVRTERRKRQEEDGRSNVEKL
jgi:hypothetical protein